MHLVAGGVEGLRVWGCHTAEAVEACEQGAMLLL